VPVLLTGTWQIDLTGDYVDTCTYEIIQTGATIEGTMDCVDLGPGTFTGTIGVNGDFDITGALFGQTFAAQGTTDGETLRGSWSALPSGASGSLTGVMVEPESEVLGVSVPPIPETSASILAMDEIPINAAVIGTNLVLAFVLLAILLVSSSVFNDTLQHNRFEIEGFLSRIFAPVLAVLTFVKRPFSGGPSWLGGILAFPVMLLATGFIYSFQNADVGLNGESFLLFCSLVLGVGITTVVYEGGQAIVMQRRYRVEAHMDVVPFALGIAAFFVLLSRLVDFQAPILYGFVAAASIARASDVEEEMEAQAIAFPSLLLLVLALVSWALLGPLRDLAGDDPHWWVHIPSEACAIVFAGGVEGLVFAMIPLAFTDGIKVFHWQKLLWLLLFSVPAFLFCWVILNPEAQAFSALLEGRVILAFSLVLAYAALALGTWLFFLRYNSSRTPPEGASAAPPPIGPPPAGPSASPQAADPAILLPHQRADGPAISDQN